MIDDDDEVIVAYGCAKPTDLHLLATVHAVDDEIVAFLEQPKPLGLTDRQLARVLAAAKPIPVGRRASWLVDLANKLGCEPSDDELFDALG